MSNKDRCFQQISRLSASSKILYLKTHTRGESKAEKFIIMKDVDRCRHRIKQSLWWKALSSKTADAATGYDI